MPRRGRNNLSRSCVELAVGLSLALVVLRAWCVDWFVVASGSMAPVLLGPHAQVTCGECGLPLVYGIEDAESQGRPAVCPNCGAVGQPIDDPFQHAGDRLPVDKAAFGLRSPRRWEIVAYHDPEAAARICVKRVVGLPGEAIEIRDGDVFADGEIQRKALGQQRAMAVLVHDNNHRPEPRAKLPPRWRSDEDTSEWHADGSGFVHSPTVPDEIAGSPRIDWLTYHHQRRVPGAPDAAEETPVVDVCGYNQTRPVLTRYAIHDLLLSCRVRIAGNGSVAFRACDGQDVFVAVLDSPSQLARLERDGRDVFQCQVDLSGLAVGALVDVSLVDRQFLLAVDGEPLLVFPYDRSDGDWEPMTRPLAIGSAGGAVEVRDIRVLRDVYYVPVSASGGPARRDAVLRLASDQFFVLGDNSPLSRDSRGGSPDAAVPAKLLLGKPLIIRAH